MDEKLESTLSKLGLSPGEVKAYIALVTLGSSSVGPIIEKAQISSSKIYMVLDKLIHKGLVSFIVRDKVKYFEINEPHSLIEYLGEKEKEITQIKSDLSVLVENIKKNSIPNRDDGARIYKGYKGIRTAFYELIDEMKEGSDYHFFSTGYGGDDKTKNLFKNIAYELKEKKINIKGLASKKEKKLFEDYYKKLGYKMKYTEMKFPSDITVIDNVVLFLVWKEEEAQIYRIDSAAMANSYLEYFETIYS